MDISNLYQIPNADFLKYNALLSCIPNTWKLKLKEETINTKREENNLELILKSKHVNRLLYSIQIKNTKTNEKKSEQKWEEQFQNIKWKIVYTTYIRSTISSIIRNFQYKFLTRILPTNKWLYKCKLVNSSLCDFCNMFTDSINHLFWECQHIQQFWRDLHTFLATKHVYIDFSYELISFGFLDNSQLPYSKNFIVFSAKYFIFINKCNKTIPDITNYKNYLYKQINVEKQIAINRDKLETHEQKWKNIFTE